MGLSPLGVDRGLLTAGTFVQNKMALSHTTLVSGWGLIGPTLSAEYACRPSPHENSRQSLAV